MKRQDNEPQWLPAWDRGPLWTRGLGKAGTEWMIRPLWRQGVSPGALTEGRRRRKQRSCSVLRLERVCCVGPVSMPQADSMPSASALQHWPARGQPTFLSTPLLPFPPSPSVCSRPCRGRKGRRCTGCSGQQAASASHDQSLHPPHGLFLRAGLNIAIARLTLESDSM